MGGNLDIMKQEDAKYKAIEWHLETGEHAFVVDMDGTVEWFAESYFDNGFEGGFVIWGTSWE